MYNSRPGGGHTGYYPQKAGSFRLNNIMRMLWERHAARTGMTIIIIVEGWRINSLGVLKDWRMRSHLTVW
jgi:hypothetical protein